MGYKTEECISKSFILHALQVLEPNHHQHTAATLGMEKNQMEYSPLPSQPKDEGMKQDLKGGELPHI